VRDDVNGRKLAVALQELDELTKAADGEHGAVAVELVGEHLALGRP
jgi:hypothetical protein